MSMLASFLALSDTHRVPLVAVVRGGCWRKALGFRSWATSSVGRDFLVLKDESRPGRPHRRVFEL